MTMYRQLLILLWITMVISLSAVLFINIRSSSESLQAQLRVNTENSLTSLGMRLTPFLEPVDKASVEVTLNAAFDGTFYRRISVEIFDTEETLIRENLANPEGVPAWFIDLFEIEPFTAEAPVTTGWTESAVIKIEGHPGFVQQQLWQLNIDLLILYGSLFVAIAMLSSVGLRILIRPLNQIEHQAHAIENKDFSYRVPEPRIKELKRVVSAMNRLTDILNERFSDNARQLDALQSRVQQDTETGIANRRHLLNEFEAAQAEGERSHAFIMVRLLKGESIRKSYGYPVWIAIVKRTIELFQERFPQQDTVIGRMSEYEIGVLVTVLPSDDLTVALQEISDQLIDLNAQGIAPEKAIFNMTGTQVQTEDTVASLLTRIDTQLREVDSRGTNQFSWTTGQQGQDRGLRTGQAWVDLLRQRISDKALSLRHQPVVKELKGKPVQKEVYVRLRDEGGQEMNAGAFLPVIEQFDLGAKLDLAVLEKVIEEADPTPQAINVSLSSMRDTQFISRLTSISPEEAARICIEFPEAHQQREPEVVDSFTQILHSLNLHFGIDNVASGGVNLDYVARIRPDYIKIAPSICRAQDEASVALMTSLCNTVHNLAIPVYATVVENEQQLSRLQETGIDGFQGYINNEEN